MFFVIIIVVFFFFFFIVVVLVINGLGFLFEELKLRKSEAKAEGRKEDEYKIFGAAKEKARKVKRERNKDR